MQKIIVYQDLQTVWFEAGVTYSKLTQTVDAHQLALQNLPSLPHINIVGSMITGTHGSGYNHQILAEMVLSYDIVMANGSLQKLTQNDSEFFPVLFSFGGLGIITSMTIKLVPSFNIFKQIYENLSWHQLFQNFDQIMHQYDYLSLFCDWREKVMTTVWVGQICLINEDPVKQNQFYGATHILTKNIHMIKSQDASCCISTGKGKWIDKICHFLPDKDPSSAGNEIQSEYFVKYENFIEIMEKLYQNKSQFQHLVQCTEIRMIKGDSFAMSNCKGHQSFIAIHFTWLKQQNNVINALRVIENILDFYNAKPHFGKLFVMNGDKFEKMYADDLIILRNLLKKYDPYRKFGNQFIDQYIINDLKPTL